MPFCRITVPFAFTSLFVNFTDPGTSGLLSFDLYEFGGFIVIVEYILQVAVIEYNQIVCQLHTDKIEVVVFKEFKNFRLLVRKNFLFDYFPRFRVPVFPIDEYAVTEYNFILEFDIAAYGDVGTDFFHDVIRHMIISSAWYPFDWILFSFGSYFDRCRILISGDITVITEFDNILSTF